MTSAPPLGQVPQPAAKPGNGLAVAGLILGIAGIVLFCLWYLALPCAIVGLILSIMAKKKAQETGSGAGMAKAGLILCVIALALDILIVILVLVFGAAILSWGHHMQQQMQNMPHNSPSTLLHYFIG